MRIVATSDLHGTLPDIPECDLLIIAGDVCPVHDHSVSFQRSWLESNFSEWLRAQPTGCIIGIGGNHDFALECWPELGPSLPWKWLLDSSYIYNGVRIHGLPWVPNLSRWAWHAMDHVIDEKLLQIAPDTEIVVMHGPPHGYCDFTAPQFGSVNAGFPGTNVMLNSVRPKLYICGHIHEGYGVARHPSGTMIFNVSHMTENYEPTNAPIKLLVLENGHIGYAGAQL